MSSHVRSRVARELRLFRDSESRQNSLEGYKILQNETIEHIAETLPKTILELLQIKGIGPAKSKKYGPAILRIIEEVSAEPADKSEEKIYSVGEFVDVLNRALSTKKVSVRGEVTRIDKRGYNVYFSIKDQEDEAVLNCFARERVFPINVEIEPGHELIVVGFPSIYKPSGRFSLTVEECLLSGEGLLLKAFEELKVKLEKEGLFDEEKKRKIPPFPTRVGLITASGSEAQKDFYKNIGSFGMKVSFFDVRVQGTQSVSQIVEALRYLNEERQDLDVIVLTRGGGSLEDLQAFNSESVARAIRASRIPVIVGVGHEGDVSISDMVADSRVSTPTAAAEMVSLEWKKAEDNLKAFELNIVHNTSHLLGHIQDRLSRYGEIYNSSISGCIGRTKLEVRSSYDQLRSNSRRIFDLFGRVDREFRYHSDYLKSLIKEKVTAIAYIERQLEGANPQHKLRQGYALVFGDDGKIIKNSKKIKKGSIIRTQLSEGELKSRVV